MPLLRAGSIKDEDEESDDSGNISLSFRLNSPTIDQKTRKIRGGTGIFCDALLLHRATDLRNQALEVMSQNRTLLWINYELNANAFWIRTYYFVAWVRGARGRSFSHAPLAAHVGLSDGGDCDWSLRAWVC